MIFNFDSASYVFKNVSKKLESVTSSTSNKDYGKTLFVDEMLQLAPFKAVAFIGWNDWEQNPVNNRSWQWRLNWLSFLSYLMAYHNLSKDDAVLDMARDSIQSWLDTYLKTDITYPFEFTWHDHATALRAEQLIFFAYYCRVHAPNWSSQHADFLVYLEHSLRVHGELLAKDDFYSKHTNHGLEQARVLLLLATVFESEQAKIWQQIAINRISSELDFSFTDEGVHVENSPAYHIFVFKVFIGIIKDYPEEVLGKLSDRFSQFSAKALSFITYILRPDGKLPPIGDTEQLPTSNSYAESFSGYEVFNELTYALSLGRNGITPKIINRVYPHSGYAIFRDKWPDKNTYKQAFHIVMKLGCLSRYHHQQDEGHVSVFGWGEDWLIDSGLYNYVNADPVRKYMRGRAGHNVPLVSGARYSKQFEHRLNSWRVIDFSDSEVNPKVSLELKVLESVRQERTFHFLAESKRLCVSDEFKFYDEQPHDITLQWHIPSDKTISIVDNRVSIVSSSGHQCILSFQNAEPDSIRVLKGRKNDKVYSCISYKANKLETSQVVHVVFKNRSVLLVNSVFEFFSSKNVPVLTSSPAVHEVKVDSKVYEMDLPDFKTDYIQKFIADYGRPYEAGMLEAMSIGLKPMDLVLDVGANIGNHTLYLAYVLGCRVFAFEPNVRLYKPLERSVKLNKMKDLVQVFPYGVGRASSKARLTRFNESNLGAQSLELISGEDEGIDVIRLDDQKFEHPVAAIKIDVEGMELDVLEGAELLIQKDRPLLVIESVDTAHYDTLQDFIKRNNYVYCSSFNGTPTHFFIHQDKISGSPWIDLFFAKGREFYQMRHFHRKLKKAMQQINKIQK